MEIRPSYNPDSDTFYLEISSNLLESYFNNLRGMLLSGNEFKNLDVTRKNRDTALITFTVPKEDLPKPKNETKPTSVSELLKNKDLPDNLRSILNNLSKSGIDDNVDIKGVNVVTLSTSDVSNPIVKMNKLINDFINSAIKYKFSTTEFVPLINYSYDDLRDDIITAIKAKRNICLVDDFNNYLKNTQENILEFNQYYIDYIDSEYADVAILINSGNIEEFKKQFSPKLKKVSWV